MQLNPKETYIILFTRGRIHKQKTLKYFTPELIARTIVVTCASELQPLKEALSELGVKPMGFKAFPDDYRLIKKRYFMVKWLYKHGCKQFLFTDDDASLQVLIDGRYKSTRTEPGQVALNKFWDRLPGIWSDYEGIGFAASSRNNLNFLTEERRHSTGLYVHENTKNACMFGYKTAGFLERFEFLEKHELLQDVAYMDLMSNFLTLQDSTYVRLYDVAWATNYDADPNSGGMNKYRNTATNNKAVALLHILFPGCMSLAKGSDVVTFDTGKVNRHAWKPVSEWKPEKFQWLAWYHTCMMLLTRLGKPDEVFPSVKSRIYLQSLIRKLSAMAGKDPKFTLEIGNGTTVLHGVTNDPEKVRQKVRFLIRAGEPVYPVLTEPRPDQRAKNLALQINRAVLSNWRKV